MRSLNFSLGYWKIKRQLSRKFLCLLITGCLAGTSLNIYGQDNSKVTSSQNHSGIKIKFPENEGWNVIREGDTLKFKVMASGGSSNQYTFSITGEDGLGISFDSLGNFSWSPGYDFVDRVQEDKKIQLRFEAKNDAGESAYEQVEFYIKHVNRLPEIGSLKNFYIKYNTENTYQIDINAITDEDNDPVIFKSISKQMPEGANLSEKGEFKWKPSFRQFRRLKKDPIIMSFIVEDQPYKSQVKGQFNILATQMDLPPEILIVPKEKNIVIQEDETINLKFFLSDPNGDDDIRTFDFTTDNIRIGKDNLIQNSRTQWEFIWTPGYDFVSEPGDSIVSELIFLVIDNTYKRDQEKIVVTVHDAENKLKKDELLYNQYKAGLVRAWELIEQLEAKEKEIRKELKVAKRGKKTRAVANASLGAVTGLSPVFLEDDPQKIVSGIGGTTTLTLGTLEATNVIGKSPSDMINRLNKVIEKKNELKIQGDIFARKYALRLSRRGKDFDKDLQKLVAALNLKNPAALELDAGWKSKRKPTDENIKDTFKDFNTEF